MSRRVVMFDMDGVLVDFLSGFNRAAQSLGITPPLQVVTWDSLAGYSGVWEHIRTSETFWIGLRRLCHIDDLSAIQEMKDRHDVYFVTSRPGTKVKEQSEEWLQNHGILFPTVILSPKKGEVAHALGATHAIDDKAGNAVAISYMSKKTQSYILDAPYNQFSHAVIGGKVKRVFSVKDFIEEVEK